MRFEFRALACNQIRVLSFHPSNYWPFAHGHGIAEWTMFCLFVWLGACVIVYVCIAQTLSLSDRESDNSTMDYVNNRGGGVTGFDVSARPIIKARLGMRNYGR